MGLLLSRLISIRAPLYSPRIVVSPIDQFWGLSNFAVRQVVVVQPPIRPIDTSLPQSPTRQEQTWVWNNIPYYGKDTFTAVGPSRTYDLAPTGPYRLEQTWIWNNTGYYGKDTLVPGKYYTDRPDSVIWYRTWEQSVIRIPGAKPFNQQDWPNPRRVTWYNSLEQSGIKALIIPFNQIDWPNPYPISWYKDWNQNLVLIFPSGKPFFQSDWPNPIPVSWYKSWEQQGLRIVPLSPFNQFDWPNPQPIQWYKEWLQNLVLNYPSGEPFYQLDWPLPKGHDHQRATTSYRDWFNSLVLTHPSGKPFNQQDWPIPNFPYGWYRDWNQDLVLIVPSGKPFNQQDWPVPQGYYRVDQTWVQSLLEGTLGVPPKPFVQTDWPLPQPVTWDRFWTQSPKIVSTVKPFGLQGERRIDTPYWDLFVGENIVLLFPPTTPASTAANIYFKPSLRTLGHMGYLGGLP